MRIILSIKYCFYRNTVYTEKNTFVEILQFSNIQKNKVRFEKFKQKFLNPKPILKSKTSTPIFFNSKCRPKILF